MDQFAVCCTYVFLGEKYFSKEGLHNACEHSCRPLLLPFSSAGVAAVRA
jgi:hypothetical protein